MFGRFNRGIVKNQVTEDYSIKKVPMEIRQELAESVKSVDMKSDVNLPIPKTSLPKDKDNGHLTSPTP